MGKKKEENTKVVRQEKFEVSDKLTRAPLHREDPRNERNLYPQRELENFMEDSQEADDEEESEVLTEEETNEQENENSHFILSNESQKFQNEENEVAYHRGQNKPSTPAHAPKDVKKYSPISKPKQHQKNIPLYLLPLLVPIIICALSFVYYIWVMSYSLTTNTHMLDFTAIMSSLKEEFNDQPKMSFRVVRNALSGLNISEPVAPAVILLLAAKGAEDATHQLAHKLAKAVSSKHLTISGGDKQLQDSDVGKKKIDSLIQTLNEKEFNAVLVEDLHLMPGSTALMLHTYCDHENAPFKRAVFILTVASEEKISEESKHWDETVNNRLADAWNDIDEDQRFPLVTRLSVAVAAITAGSLS